MKLITFGLLILFLSACASYHPETGMTFQEWDMLARKSSKGSPELVAQKNNLKVYDLPDDSAEDFYFFADNKLTEITHGDRQQMLHRVERTI